MTATRSLPRHLHHHHHSVVGATTFSMDVATTVQPTNRGPLPPRKRRQSSSEEDFHKASSSPASTGPRRYVPVANATTTTDGCGILKALITNIMTFATRSRRKVDLSNNKERGTVNQTIGPNAPISSHLTEAGASGFTAPSTPAKKNEQQNIGGSTKMVRKATLLETQLSTDATCVADSIDNDLLEQVIRQPPRICKNEWLATQTLALFDHVNALCGTMTDLCTPVTCSTMSYPGVTKANWIDERGKRHHYSAMRYIDSVMAFCEASRQNQNYFPTKFGCVFSNDFETVCHRMIRLMWHCCGHLYSKHWDQLNQLNIHLQFSLVLAHLWNVIKLYSILEPKEVSILQTTLQAIRPNKPSRKPSIAQQKTALTTTTTNTLIQRPSKKRSNVDKSIEGLQKQPNTTIGNRWPIKCHPTQPENEECQQLQNAQRQLPNGGKWASWGGLSTINRISTTEDYEHAKENVAIPLTVADLLNGTANCKCYAQTC